MTLSLSNGKICGRFPLSMQAAEFHALDYKYVDFVDNHWRLAERCDNYRHGSKSS